jgi:phosphoenolpyruvate carboxykinase (ATP)
MNSKNYPVRYGIDQHGIGNVGRVFWTPSTPVLYEEIVRRREGLIAHLGPIVVRTGHYTGRSPDDKRIVREASSEKKIYWGSVNVPLEPAKFEMLHSRLLAYLQGRDLFVQDCYVGAAPAHRIPIRIITEYAWHSLFARNMFIQIEDRTELANHLPQFTVINTPRFHALPDLDGTNSEAYIIVNFGKKLILIGGTSYGGEIKKSIFTLLNFLYPQKGILSMHCSANVGSKGDVAIFFGLSGTGKTTLSADPERQLIGDDEHGWSNEGIFNCEGGCYAKVIKLSKEAEPQIYECTRRFGTILENVAIDVQTRRIDLNDASLTENTRAGYPVSHIENAVRTGIGGHPRNIIMLTYDAFGVFPPVAKLTPDQAKYHFLTGYTAKVAGTERGLGTEPQATFSTCFGGPFMTLPPVVYARLLREKISNHNVNCWLVNTGLIGGRFGTGERIKIVHSRAIIRAILNDSLRDIPTELDPILNLQIPTSCEGIPQEILKPRKAWKNPKDYEKVALDLAAKFRKNFEQFAPDVYAEVREAGPRVGS